ncbi:MAG TPA: class I SAM-dependent methyltransferase [Burkholderiales bacterium]|nr:class I SAM-dependent methyltransferase [Burkholderiales bacterium]
MANSEGFDDAREFWDQRFAAEEYIFGLEPNVFLVSQRALFHPGMRVLDVAAGEGRNAVWLAEQGCEVLGIDLSPIGLEKARRLAAERGVAVAFEEADVRTWQWQQNSFDAIVSIFIQFAAPSERAIVFEGMQRALRPGGVLLIQGYTPQQVLYKTGGPPQVEHMYTTEMLRSAFAQLDIIHLAEHEEVLCEGSKHVGRSALIDLVARKPA